MISTALTTMFVVIAAVLWWKLRAARDQNVLLRAEVTQLRRRLYNLLP